MAREAVSADSWQHHPQWGRVPPLAMESCEGPCERLVVVAAHPDDESIGAGGLITTAHRAGLAIYLVLLTAGEAADATFAGGSHHRLAVMRLAEMTCAVELLAPGTPVVFLGAQDAQVADSEDKIEASLTEIVADGSRTLIAAPWRHDGHPDHEAAGRAAAAAAAASGARLIEYPIRLWLDHGPQRGPWDQLAHLPLDAEQRQAKRAAIACHVSQMRQRDGGSRRFPHLTEAVEHYVVSAPDDQPSSST